MFTQKSINIFHSVQEIRPFSLFQNLALGKASTDDKCHFAIVSLFSEFESRQKLSSISNVIWLSHGVHFVNINVYAKFHLTIPLSSRDSAIINFQNLELGKASNNEKCHFAISWARSCQYQCLCNILSKYSTQFKR